MNKIYDNGTLILGNINQVIEYIENDERLESWEFEELLEDLYKLKDTAYIVMINLDTFPEKYSINYWTKGDIIND